jgi:hypothetical protein
LPGRVPFIARLLDEDSARDRGRFGRKAEVVGTSGLGLRCLALEEDAYPLHDVDRDLVAPALGPQDLLQLALEVRVSRARTTGDEMLLDLQADAAVELPVEVELEPPQDLLAINR